MKVVHIIPGLKLGGAEKTLCRLLGAFDLRRFDNAVIALSEGGGLESELALQGIPVFNLAMRSGRPPWFGLWRLIRILRRIQPDVIQGWLYKGNLAALAGQALSLPGVPVVWNVRHSLEDLECESSSVRRDIDLGRRFSGRASCIIFNAEKSAKQHFAYGYAHQRSIIIPNGFDGAKFRPSSIIRKRVRTSLGLREKDIVIGLIARFHPVKGHPVFFQAARNLLCEFPEVRLVLAGGGIEHHNRNLTGQIAHYGLTGQVIVAGERNDLPDFLNCLDIATLSSHSEGFPNALGEAMACGIPCVATDVGDAAMIIGSTGKIVPPRDPVSLARAWREMIALGPEGREMLGREARTRVLENFSFPNVVDRYGELYSSLCGISRDKV